MLPLQLMYLSCACITLFSRNDAGPCDFRGNTYPWVLHAIAGGPGDWGRFRHPAMPIICMLAGMV